jgi:hypothetical protein
MLEKEAQRQLRPLSFLEKQASALEKNKFMA